jgi:hypothetical protein
MKPAPPVISKVRSKFIFLFPFFNGRNEQKR